MELGEHPRQFFLRVDRLVKEMEWVGRPTVEKDTDIAVLTGLYSQYDAEVRMLESSADWLDRAWIELAVYNQYGRLTREKSEAGPKALASVSRVVSPPKTYASFVHKRGTPRRTAESWSKPNANRRGMASAAAGYGEVAKLIKIARRLRTETTRKCTA